VATARFGSPQIVIQSGGKLVTRDLPGTFAGVQLQWSPDGSALLVRCYSYYSYNLPNLSVSDQVILLQP